MNKKKIIIPVSPVGILNKFGYYSLDPVIKRRKALDEAMKYYSYASIIQRLNAVAIRFKNKKPEITKNIRKDMIYLKNKYKSKNLRRT